MSMIKFHDDSKDEAPHILIDRTADFSDEVFSPTSPITSDAVHPGDPNLSERKPIAAYTESQRSGYKNYWDYAIKMKSFHKEKGSAEQDNFKLIYSHIVDIVGQRNVYARQSGVLETEHAFIMVSADLELLEHHAVKIHMDMPVNMDAPGMRFSDSFMPYDHSMKRDRLFKHPLNKPCQTPSDQPCQCNLFTPYQQSELVRSMIYTALDNAHSESIGELTVHKGFVHFKKAGVILDFYPLHKNGNPCFYEETSAWTKEHCSYRHALTASNGFSSRSGPFIRYIRDYFGEKIGLYFAFLHHYNKFLLILFGVGIVLALIQYTYMEDNALIPVYSIILCLWCAVMLKFWKRECADYAFEWGMDGFESKEEELEAFSSHVSQYGHIKERSSGFYEPGGRWVDLGDYYQHASAKHGKDIGQFVPSGYRDTAGKCPTSCFSFYGGDSDSGRASRAELSSIVFRFYKESLSLSVMVTMVGVTIVATVSLLVARHALHAIYLQNGDYAAGAANAVTITILAQVYQKLAIKLTEWENHRTTSQFEDKLATKLFLFNFINSYFSLFYIAFYRAANGTILGKSDSCNSDADTTCIGELSSQLLSLLIARPIINGVVGVLVPMLTTKVELWADARKVKKQLKFDNPSMTDKEIEATIKHLKSKKTMSEGERQGNKSKYEVHPSVNGVFNDWNELVLGFGFVVLFAPAFPLAPLVMFLSNVVESSTDSWKIFNDYQRPRYAGAADIGRWLSILQFLAFMAVITNSGFMVFTSNIVKYLFHDPPLWQLAFIAFTLEHIIFAIILTFNSVMNDKRPSLREDLAVAEMIKQVEFEFDEWKSSKEVASKQFDSLSDASYRKESIVDKDHPAAVKYLSKECTISFAN